MEKVQQASNGVLISDEVVLEMKNLLEATASEFGSPLVGLTWACQSAPHDRFFVIGVSERSDIDNEFLVRLGEQEIFMQVERAILQEAAARTLRLFGGKAKFSE
jgi:hypothetical protein